jgi:hypothetical protein
MSGNWDAILTTEDRAILARGRWAQRAGFGKSPALLLIVLHGRHSRCARQRHEISACLRRSGVCCHRSDGPAAQCRASSARSDLLHALCSRPDERRCRYVPPVNDTTDCVRHDHRRCGGAPAIDASSYDAICTFTVRNLTWLAHVVPMRTLRKLVAQVWHSDVGPVAFGQFVDTTVSRCRIFSAPSTFGDPR